MKLYNKSKIINYSITMIGLLCSLHGSSVYARVMEQAKNSDGKSYIGVSVGNGNSNKIKVNQYGTAFLSEATQGGPLAVDAFGKTNSKSVDFIGGQIGYQWSKTKFFAPAIELEGFNLGKNKFKSHDINNNTDRLLEHDFYVKLPLKSEVFLMNAVANFDFFKFKRFHPFVGVGIGGAVLSVSNASAIQVSPPETVNHFNSNPSDKDTTFAGQVKLGVNTDITKHFSLFVEYKRMFIGSSEYNFGSTLAEGHAVTSSWNVHLDSQYYNMGSIGLRLNT